MTDDPDFQALRAALQRGTPAPDPAAKAAHLRLATENFTKLHQETPGALRPTSDRPARAGFLKGVFAMLSALTSRQALAATTSIAALGLGIILVLPDSRPPMPVVITQPELTPDPTKPLARKQAPAETETALPQPEADTLGQIVAQDAAPADATADSGPTSPIIAEPTPAPTGTLAEAPMADSTTNARVRGTTLQSPTAPAMDSAGIVVGGADGMTAYAPAPIDQMPSFEPNTEAFPDADQNPLKITAEAPVSTFSIDVDTASYALIRQSLMTGTLPPKEAVRIEEMINYFPYAYPAPSATDAPFKTTVSVLPTPWNPDTELVHIAIQGRLPALDTRPPLNLVFLIDTSGSMEDSTKLPLLKQSFRLMVGQLRAEDQVSIVTYAGSSGQVLAPTKASETSTILNALDQLTAGGSTAGEAGLQQAYSVAASMAADGEITRVILATDGDFNVGLDDPTALEDYIAEKRKSGTYLSVLGFGRGNLDDATMQALAQAGNGQAAYIDTLAEAQKVLVDQLTGALFPIADDVKIQVEWNPATVAEYRLIGYETRALNREDFNNDRVDAGEIGAGHSVTAIYEITRTGSPAQLSEPLRYQAATPTQTTPELGFLKLRYKEPGTETSALIETPINPDLSAVTPDTAFSAAIAGFGQLLTGSQYLGDWSYRDAIALATTSKGADPFGYRGEAVTLMRLAETLSKN